jgi:hypothetical protein
MNTEFKLGDYAYCQLGILGHIESITVVDGRTVYRGYAYGSKWSSVKPTFKGKTQVALTSTYLKGLNQYFERLAVR